MTRPNPAKVALVTGSGRQRVGNLIARDLAAAGYAVAIHYHQSETDASETVDELQATGATARALQADITSPTDVRRMFQELRQSWQRLDVLVNTASIWSATPLEQIDAEHLLEQFRVNTLGTFLCAQQAGRIMVPQPNGGAVINFGDAAILQPRPDYAAYYISKGALPTLTRTLAVELAARNPRIRVNCIQPGSIMFPTESADEERQRRIDATLLKRADDPQAVVHAVRFLIENPFITGECLTLDGGRHLQTPFR